MNWFRVLTLQPFDESNDLEDAGSPLADAAYVFFGLATLLIVIAEVIAYAAYGVAHVEAFAAAVVLCALQAGAAWHAKMPGKAKNGMVRAVFYCSLLVLFMSEH